MKIAITGKTGYIANNLKLWLEKFDFEVDLISVRNNNEFDFYGYSVVIHCASIVHQKEKIYSEQEYFKVNSELTQEIAIKSKRCGVKQFIFLSSMSVYGMNNGKITLQTKENPTSLYGKSKLEAEKKLKQIEDNNFKVAIIRPPMIYGKDCPGNYKRLSKLAKIIHVFPMVKNNRSMLYIDNFCEFIRLIIMENKQGLFFPQNREYVNTSKLVKAIAVSNCRKLYLIKGFEKIILLFNIGILNKIFGSLIYDTQMSDTFQNSYNIIDFIESINKTEKK